MLLIDCEQSDCSMTLAVLDFTIKLLETGLENDIVLSMIVFSLQYVLVNHESWKFNVKHARWKVTVKVLEVMKKCVQSIPCYQKLGEIIRDILRCDSFVHRVLFRIVCTTTQSLEKLYVSRLFDILDIEGLQLAISSGLDVLSSMVSALSKDSLSFPVFHQTILSAVTKPMPVIASSISLISYFRNPKIQVEAARLLSVLFVTNFSQSYTFSNASLGLDDKEVSNFKKSICKILCEQLHGNGDLIVATLKLLTSAACNQAAFLTALIESKGNLDAKSRIADREHWPNKTENGSFGSKEESLLDAILCYVENSEDLLKNKPNILLSLLNFLRALWQDAPQFTKVLEQLKCSDKFWRKLTNPVMLIINNQDNFPEKLTEGEIESQTYKFQYLSSLLDILGYEMFLQKKLMHAELIVNRIPKSATNETETIEDSKVRNEKSVISLKEIISTWCKSSLLSDMIKACVSCEYDSDHHWRAKVAAALCAVRVMVKLKSGDSGSLSISLIERTAALSQKLRKLPAFSELLTQYADHGYSGEQDLDDLILSDLFYHIQGEIEGRHIDHKLFKGLLQFLLDSEFLDAFKYKQDDDILSNISGVYLYDSVRLRADLGLEMWDLLAWKESKEVAETMLVCLRDVNSMMLHSSSKLSALRGIITLLHMHDDNLTENQPSSWLEISGQLVSTCIDHTCQHLHATLEPLTSALDASKDILDILTAQAELLLLLTRFISSNFSQRACVLVLKTSGYGLKVLCNFRQSVGVGTAKKFFLMLIIGSVRLNFKDLRSGVSIGIESIEVSAEASNASLGLLPVLCECIEHSDHCALSLTAIDFILRGFSTPATWFPIIQKHLPLQHIIQKLHDITFSKTVSVTLKFLLNFARVRQGAEMLLNAGILASLRMFLSDFSEGGPFSVIQSEMSFFNMSDKTEKPQLIWGLCLAVLTAIIQSLEDSSSSTSIVDYVIPCILIEKAPIILYYISAPDFPLEDREKKRARALKSNISLSELKETQNTLTLICVLARHRNSWNKVLKDMESQLREKSIHFLAFISQATQHPGDSSRREAPLLCHPVLNEEFEWHKEPSFINSGNGWFALSAISCKLNLKFASLSCRTALVIKDQSNANLSPQTHFSDLIAIEIYKIAFLLLTFLCIQAESAARKAEEVGFVDLAHFPELPMPDILHGLQDQGLAIITELCEANKRKQLAPEIQDVCCLMLQIIVMALYLEFCVIQICDIRPILGHVETFSKELQLLIRATEGHLFLKESLKDLKQIVSFVYPELLHAEALY